MDIRIRNNVVRSLEKIRVLLAGFGADKERCLNNFEKWSNSRRDTLLALQKFQEEFDKIHQYSSAGRAVGNGATLLGSLATIIGFGLSFSKDLKPVGKELMTYGSAVSTVGGAASITASLAEKGFSAAVLNEVKATLEKDQRLTEELLDWFQRTEKLDSHLQEVFDCGVTDITDIFTAIGEISVTYSKGGEALNNIQYYLSSLIKENFSLNRLPYLDNEKLEKILFNASYKVKLILLEFCNDSNVRKAIWSIYESLKRNPILFDLSKVSIRIVRKMTMQGNSLSSLISSAGGQSLLNCANLTARGIFQTITVALSVIAFLSAVEDIKDGRSKYSKMLDETKKYLSIELATLESYPMLRR